eukprot:scaffold484265_cov38-Prasinocladus_malaysianus.AAC.1
MHKLEPILYPGCMWRLTWGRHLLEDAGLHGIHRVLGNAAEGLWCGGRPGRDANAAQKLLLHQINAPHEKVDVAHRATAHSAVDLNEPGALRC